MCNTCELIKRYKKDSEKTDNDIELYAVIRRVQYKDGELNGSLTSGINALNFCPTCGEEINND